MISDASRALIEAHIKGGLGAALHELAYRIHGADDIRDDIENIADEIQSCTRTNEQFN